MTDDEKKRELIRYRLRQADESLEEAVFLLSGKKGPAQHHQQDVRNVLRCSGTPRQ